MDIIRQWQMSDAADLASALSHNEVQDNLRDGLPFPYTVEDAQNFIQSMLAVDTSQVLAFAITDGKKAVGSIGIYRQQNIHYRTAEMGYYVAPSHWGQGLATKAIQQACQYTFTHTNIVRIFAEPFAHNIASCKVLEKCRFICEGTLHQNAEKNGQLLDMKLYALLKN